MIICWLTRESKTLCKDRPNLKSLRKQPRLASKRTKMSIWSQSRQAPGTLSETLCFWLSDLCWSRAGFFGGAVGTRQTRRRKLERSQKADLHLRKRMWHAVKRQGTSRLEMHRRMSHRAPNQPTPEI